MSQFRREPVVDEPEDDEDVDIEGTETEEAGEAKKGKKVAAGVKEDEDAVVEEDVKDVVAGEDEVKVKKPRRRSAKKVDESKVIDEDYVGNE
jgi:hypothetical protein